MDKKPNVFPTSEQMAQANETGGKISTQLQEENQVVPQLSADAEANAAAEMKRRTDEQLKMRDENLRRSEEIARETEANRAKQATEKQPYDWGENPPQPPSQQPPQQPPIDNNSHDYYGGNGEPEKQKPVNTYIEQLSQPQMNQPFDLIPLPSEGRLYPGIKKSVKVAFLTTADENILTSPNLVESGEFLEILINRKLLEPNIRYKDLLPGDRNAIMLWLRATGYGEMYPVTLTGKDNEPFDTEINLSELKTINLNVDADREGLFGFELPLSKNKIRFKLLTVGDLDDLEDIMDNHKDDIINQEQTLIFEKQIIEVNGNKDKTFIKDFIINMRVLDAQKLREFMGSIECGVDMTIEVRSPGGETIRTFLPLTPKFFWPNSQL